MAVARLAREANADSPRPPRRSVLWGIALAGIAAGGVTMWLALNSDHVAEPGLQAALMDWITLPYVFAGLIAWYRRPDSRFGPLMVVAGFSMFLSTLAWANARCPTRSAPRSTCCRRSSSSTSSWRSRAGGWSTGSSALSSPPGT